MATVRYWLGFINPVDGRDDTVAVGVGIGGEHDAKPILEANEPGHGIRARRVHADLAVMVDGHEGEARVDDRIDDGDVESIEGIDGLPVVSGGAAERVDRERQAGPANGVHVEDVAQIVDVGQDEVLLMSARRRDGGRERHAFHAGVAVPQQRVGPVLHPVRHVRVRRSTVRRVCT